MAHSQIVGAPSLLSKGAPAIAFDENAKTVPRDGPPLATVRITSWPCVRVVSANWRGKTDVVVLMPDAGSWMPPEVLGCAVAALDRGGAVAVHARDFATVDRAAAVLWRCRGGGHA